MSQLVTSFWQGRREEISNTQWRGFLRTIPVPGPLLSPFLLCVRAQSAMQISKVLAEIMCHDNKILSLSKLVFGEDPNGINELLKSNMPLAIRSLFPYRMKWLIKNHVESWSQEKMDTLWSCRLFSYIIHILCISLPDWYFLVYTIYSIYTITSQTFFQMQIWRVLLSQQNEKSHLARNATQLLLLEMAGVMFLLLPLSLCWEQTSQDTCQCGGRK